MSKHQDFNPQLKMFFPVVRGLAKILGGDYEVNLHDVSIPENSLIMCENGHVTGRAVGGPMTDFGLYMLQSDEYKDKEGIFNYLARNNRGELIKCSAIFIRDEAGKVIGFLCVNYDISKAMAAQELIEGLLHLDMEDVEQYQERSDPVADLDKSTLPPPVREWFAQDLEGAFGDSLKKVKRRVGKPLSSLSKAEKQDIVLELHDRGFFLLKGAVDILAKEMCNTKFTIYSYIRDIQNKAAKGR
ncbi:MAG: helix-turn-helix transcriptional regulator [Synergistaceae bacterium]|nr:helix-turn-helix transcriptional regulator [Synergistaceae bacterium]